MERIFLFFALVSLLSGCERRVQQSLVQFSGEAQGTYYAVSYFDDEKRDFQPGIDSLLSDFDQSLSLWVPGSTISKINRNEPEVVLDNHFLENFRLGRAIADETGGAFDPTVGSLVRAWGFGFDATKKVDQQIIDSILEFTGYEMVSVRDGQIVKADSRVSIDFNAIAQGYAVDLIGQYLEAKAIHNYLVDIGGEVRARGQKPDGSRWRVGIEKPAENQLDARNLKAIVELKDKSIATSGNYRKFYEEDGVRYSHTIDPKSGYPVQHSLLSVSVLAENTAMADAYATAFMVMGLEKASEFLRNRSGLEAFFIYSDTSGYFQTYITDGFRERVIKSYD